MRLLLHLKTACASMCVCMCMSTCARTCGCLWVRAPVRASVHVFAPPLLLRRPPPLAHSFMSIWGIRIPRRASSRKAPLDKGAAITTSSSSEIRPLRDSLHHVSTSCWPRAEQSDQAPRGTGGTCDRSSAKGDTEAEATLSPTSRLPAALRSGP